MIGEYPVLGAGPGTESMGVTPAYRIALAVAMKVIGVVITSSPGPMPNATSARCRPCVQLVTPTACGGHRGNRREALRIQLPADRSSRTRTREFDAGTPDPPRRGHGEKTRSFEGKGSCEGRHSTELVGSHVVSPLAARLIRASSVFASRDIGRKPFKARRACARPSRRSAASVDGMRWVEQDPALTTGIQHANGRCRRVFVGGVVAGDERRSNDAFALDVVGIAAAHPAPLRAAAVDHRAVLRRDDVPGAFRTRVCLVLPVR